jgi:hypothetical protein
LVKPRLGQILVADGSLSDNEIARALGYQRFAHERFRIGSILLNWELIAEDALLAALAKLHHCPSVNWRVLSQASPEALACLTSAQASRFEALPYGVTPRGLQVAFSNPSNLASVDEVAKVTGRRVLPAVTTEVRLAQALHNFYRLPLPGHFRGVIQKLDRPKTEARETGGRPRPTRPPADPAGEAASSVPVPSPEHSLPPPKSTTRAASIRDSRPAYAIPEIHIPDFPVIEPKNSPAEVSEPRGHGTVLDPIVEALVARIPRVIVFRVATPSLTAWTGRGPGVSPDRLAAVRLPADERTVLAEAAKSGVPHFGPVEPERFPPDLGSLIQPQAPPCAVFPVRVLDGVRALLYADRLGDALPYEDFEVLARAAVSAGNVLAQSLATTAGPEDS